MKISELSFAAMTINYNGHLAYQFKARASELVTFQPVTNHVSSHQMNVFPRSKLVIAHAQMYTVLHNELTARLGFNSRHKN